jgi:hypothetical protein
MDVKTDILASEKLSQNASANTEIIQCIQKKFDMITVEPHFLEKDSKFVCILGAGFFWLEGRLNEGILMDIMLCDPTGKSKTIWSVTQSFRSTTRVFSLSFAPISQNPKLEPMLAQIKDCISKESTGHLFTKWNDDTLEEGQLCYRNNCARSYNYLCAKKITCEYPDVISNIIRQYLRPMEECQMICQCTF